MSVHIKSELDENMVKLFGDALSTSVFNKMIEEVREVNKANGWDDIEGRTFGDEIALIHTEVSEMMEAYRSWGYEDHTGEPVERVEMDGETPYLKLPKPEGVGSEAADVLIRLLDTCHRHDINIFAEYRRKLEFNKTRGWRHGGKKI